MCAENELLSHTNCTVFAYDYSVEDFADGQLSPANRDRAHFFQRAISRTTDKSKQPPHYSIADLMKENGHEYV